MARRRFLVESFQGARAALAGEQAHHLVRVLRAKPGQLFELSDGQAVWLAKIDAVGKDSVDFELLEQLQQAAADVPLVLLVSLIKFSRFEWILEKATELGVSRIVPLSAARSVKRLTGAAPVRSPRWEKILHSAAEQSRRTTPPALESLAAPSAAFGSVTGGCKLLLAEGQGVPLLQKIVRQAGNLREGAVLAIGPEGGWTEEELAAAHAAGFCEASLGSLILRTETAALAALAILSHELAASDPPGR